MIKLRIWYILILVNSALFSQSKEKAIDKLDKIFKEISYDDLVFKNSEIYPQNNIFIQKINKANYYKDSLIAEDLRIAKKDYGLEFKANGRYSLSSIVDDIDVLDNTKYNLQLGVQWNLLNEGLLHNKKKQEILSNEQRITQLESKREVSEKQYNIRYQYIIYSFNKKLLVEYEYHHTLLTKLLDVYYDLYYEYLIPYTKILEIKKDIVLLEGQIKQIQSFNYQYDFKEEFIEDIVIFDLNMEEILKYVDIKQGLDSIVNLKKENLYIKQKKNNLAKLNVFANYRLAEEASTDVKLTPSMGFSFSIPIKRKHTDRKTELETLIVEDYYTLLREEIIKGVKINCYEYEEKLKQLKRLHFKVIIEKENLLTAGFSKRYIKENTLIESMYNVNRLLQMKREIIDLSRQLYLKALAIMTFINIDTDEEFWKCIEPIDLGVHENKKVSICWDASKDLKEASFFIDYLKRKNYQYIFIKPSLNKKKNELIKEMLIKENFIIITEPTLYKVIEVESNQNLKSLKVKIRKAKEKILLNDVHKLIRIEKEALR